MDYLAMTLVELHKCLVNKEITPFELVKLFKVLMASTVTP